MLIITIIIVVVIIIIIIIISTPAGKRNRGRPLKRWRDALD